ncbi:spore coat protein [Cohnella lupini]|uniref:Coat F domain-containing protein n=1 Tax=Cohnella lupini TaxID=1294267 RepID=A0A3D9IQ76_9BACL|nr:spore coat protein [Cohnella lupini]RED63847.1 coat F domain-containing protein [Cohnella lupini]
MFNKPALTDEDLASTILSDLKRVTREYATAATESVCPEIRQMFTQLLDSTLKMQGELYTVMQQNNMYNASSPALKQELDKQLKQYQQSQQQTNQFVQQAKASQGQIPPAAMGNNSVPAYQ